MMTSAAKTNKLRPKQGFTLLEIVIVLALAAIITGGAIGMMVYSSDERALRDVSGQIESLAKQARTKAVLKQMPYALEFRDSTVRLMPYALAGRPLKNSPTDLTKNQICVIPPEMQLSILRWNTADSWIILKNNMVQVWRFDPEGLSEPIGVRVKINGSWKEDIYHPLTASIQSTQLEVR